MNKSRAITVLAVGMVRLNPRFAPIVEAAFSATPKLLRVTTGTQNVSVSQRNHIVLH
jgi:hypothetical protein